MSNVAILIFAYNRPQHLKSLFESLLRNHDRDSVQTYLFIDGPKNENDFLSNKAVIATAEEFKPLLNFEIRFRSSNLGLHQSIRTGVNEIFKKFEKVIVLEDDLVLSPFFLRFMLQGLNRFEDNNSISSISGFSYPLAGKDSSGYLLPGADCWGWGTWKNRWDEITWDSKELLGKLKGSELLAKLDLNGAYDFSEMLIDSSLGLVDSWAIYWHASMFLKNRSTYYPSKSLVANTGMDGSGTHFKFERSGISPIWDFTDSGIIMFDENPRDFSTRYAAYLQAQRGNFFQISLYNLLRAFRRFQAKIKGRRK
jgi:hypothetical protein